CLLPFEPAGQHDVFRNPSSTRGRHMTGRSRTGISRAPGRASVAGRLADRSDFGDADRVPAGFAAVAVSAADLGHTRVAAGRELWAGRRVRVGGRAPAAPAAAATAAGAHASAAAGFTAHGGHLTDADVVP